MAKNITHDGVFHADETVGMSILQLLGVLRGVILPLLRTRDMKLVEPGDVVIDVSGKNGKEGEVLFLDHHQKGGAGVRDNGVPYAACGLVWKTFGRELLGLMYPAAAKDLVEKLWSSTDRDFIAPIDASDCGFMLVTGYMCEIRPQTFSAVIASLNPAWYDKTADYNAAFEAAVQFATVALKAAISNAYGKAIAAGRVKDALDSRTDKRLLVLDKFCPWEEAVFDLPGGKEVIYVIFRADGEGRETWMCQAVPSSLHSFFSKRKALPQAWGGLEMSALQKLSGVEDAIFCHRGLFIAGAGSKEGALKLAALALAAK